MWNLSNLVYSGKTIRLDHPVWIGAAAPTHNFDCLPPWFNYPDFPTLLSPVTGSGATNFWMNSAAPHRFLFEQQRVEKLWSVKKVRWSFGGGPWWRLSCQNQLHKLLCSFRSTYDPQPRHFNQTTTHFAWYLSPFVVIYYHQHRHQIKCPSKFIIILHIFQFTFYIQMKWRDKATWNV